MVKTFWLSYDLGLKGDYEGLYAWLDNVNAKECGDSLAVFQFDCKTDYLNEIKASLKGSVEFKNGDRVYIIWKDERANGVKGTFLFGKRKPAHWKGFGGIYEEAGEDF